MAAAGTGSRPTDGRPVVVYIEHGAHTPWLQRLRREGRIRALHFPYDPDSRSSKSELASPSRARIEDLHLPIAELPGTFGDYTSSEHLDRVVLILGSRHRRDALHLDSAYKSGCVAFFTQDTDVLSKASELQNLLRMFILGPDCDESGFWLLVGRSR